MTLIRSLTVQLHRVFIVLCYAFTSGVHRPEMVLGSGVTLGHGLAIPLDRSR